jgi:hypothetical protein
MNARGGRSCVVLDASSVPVLRRAEAARRQGARPAQRDFCRVWPNPARVVVDGAHFLQEEAPDAVGRAAARFVSKVLARQIQ